ncbi:MULTISPECIES: hypothetical protein [Desulfonatronum]|uniref:hypothetical protein n=1 Tax=Desulfonatronum TaxID=66848 RepID=UPI0004ABEBCB|nr:MULTISPECIES: hypothetical protein [Desulfonatronum]PTN37759.1 hypothetical protein C6366_05870 [Desulfonatronum sp. SC1]
MSEEKNIVLKKPLDKMTAKELRELCISQIPQITGASGMDKDALVVAVREALGFSTDEENKGPSPYKDQIWSLKRQVRTLRTEKDQLPSTQRKDRNRLRRKINLLKKRTRRLAAAA